MRFWIRVYVRSGSTFSFQTKKEDLIHGLLNITESDAIFNLTDVDSQLMNGEVPWRGPREKSPEMMQNIIEELSKPGDIVVDWNAGTGISLTYLCFIFPLVFSKVSHFFVSLRVSGASIKAAQAVGRHILAFEEDEAIFNALLKPSAMGPPKHPRPAATDEAPPKRPRPDKWCKSFILCSNYPSITSLSSSTYKI